MEASVCFPPRHGFCICGLRDYSVFLLCTLVRQKTGAWQPWLGYMRHEGCFVDAIPTLSFPWLCYSHLPLLSWSIYFNKSSKNPLLISTGLIALPHFSPALVFWFKNKIQQSPFKALTGLIQQFMNQVASHLGSTRKLHLRSGTNWKDFIGRSRRNNEAERVDSSCSL